MSLLKPVTGNLITRNHSQLGTAYSPEPARVMAERPARTVSTRQHILIVEDSPTQAAGMAFALNKADFTVQIAQTGSEALEILKTARRDELPDLVCFDYHLPDMSGMQLYLQMGRYLARYHIPVIIMSADLLAIHAAMQEGKMLSVMGKDTCGQDVVDRARQMLANLNR